jgi:hypothetical protein
MMANSIVPLDGVDIFLTSTPVIVEAYMVGFGVCKIPASAALITISFEARTTLATNELAWYTKNVVATSLTEPWENCIVDVGC